MLKFLLKKARELKSWIPLDNTTRLQQKLLFQEFYFATRQCGKNLSFEDMPWTVNHQPQPPSDPSVINFRWIKENYAQKFTVLLAPPYHLPICSSHYAGAHPGDWCNLDNTKDEKKRFEKKHLFRHLKTDSISRVSFDCRMVFVAGLDSAFWRFIRFYDIGRSSIGIWVREIRVFGTTVFSIAFLSIYIILHIFLDSLFIITQLSVYVLYLYAFWFIYLFIH